MLVTQHSLRRWQLAPRNPARGSFQGLLCSQDGQSRAIPSSNGAPSRGAGEGWAGPTRFGPHCPVVKMGVKYSGSQGT